MKSANARSFLQVASLCAFSPHAAMTLAGKAYFDAVSKVGENAMASLVSRELGEFFIAAKLKRNHLGGSQSTLTSRRNTTPWFATGMTKAVDQIF